MRYELMAILALVVCLVLLCLEYLWLYILAERQEDKAIRYGGAFKKIDQLMQAAICSPTDTACAGEVESLIEYAKNDSLMIDEVCKRLLELEKRQDRMNEGKIAHLALMKQKIKPKELYMELLGSGDAFHKGFCCRRLADFDAKEAIEEIRKLVDSKNRDLSYNAAMALTILGDGDSVVDFIVSIEDDKRYSYRVIHELLRLYGGDTYELAVKLLEKCSGNNYMKSTIIKGIAPLKIKQFEQMYRDGIKSNDINYRIACVKALSALASEENVQLLIIASRDKEWVVRSEAVKGLSKVVNEETFAAVANALGDGEWWVRQAAAKALIHMDSSLVHIEQILKGYDKYAADAVKYTLYRSISLDDEGGTKAV